MVASKRKDNLTDTHTFVAPIGGKKSIRLLRSAAIYGANAAGKTNLLVAMDVMRDIVIQSAKEQVRGEHLPDHPFLLNAETRNESSEFEMHFIVGESRYQYGFSFTKERITEEWLIAYPLGHAQRWFSRGWSPESKKYEWKFSAFLTGEKKLWEKSTRDNALFLSTAVQLNSAQLQPLYDWFKSQVHPVQQEKQRPNINIAFLKEGDKEKTLNLLKDADLGIHDFLVNKIDISQSETFKDLSEEMQQKILKENKNLHDIKTIHLDSDGKPVTFDIALESSGTVKVFSLTGVWLGLLERGSIVFIDEFNHHLHLALAKFLIGKFHSNQNNPHNSQLIFTTHQVSLLNQEFLRRDQIWFCEKAKDGSTTLYPLTDFHPRKDRENLELRYIAGAYGASPYIREA